MPSSESTEGFRRSHDQPRRTEVGPRLPNKSELTWNDFIRWFERWRKKRMTTALRRRRVTKNNDGNRSLINLRERVERSLLLSRPCPAPWEPRRCSRPRVACTIPCVSFCSTIVMRYCKEIFLKRKRRTRKNASTTTRRIWLRCPRANPTSSVNAHPGNSPDRASSWSGRAPSDASFSKISPPWAPGLEEEEGRKDGPVGSSSQIWTPSKSPTFPGSSSSGITTWENSKALPPARPCRVSARDVASRPIPAASGRMRKEGLSTTTSGPRAATSSSTPWTTSRPVSLLTPNASRMA
mmetsp:Transcript_26539/g.55434  ORF Transcript_26539/g.55434 Transcript_26539/m.55434 type:complete len:295 (+) Transcript_26539:605-1489(+)